MSTLWLVHIEFGFLPRTLWNNLIDCFGGAEVRIMMQRYRRILTYSVFVHRGSIP